MNNVNTSAVPALPHRHAFTLLEIAIAVTVIGLLMGGVVAATSLQRNAAVNSVIREHNQFLTATRAFRDQYFALPGDMPNATKYWGKLAVLAANCRTTENTGANTKTCDGDGDGQVNALLTGPETKRFWQHLANAGMVDGHYTGTGPGGVITQSDPTNLPGGKLTNSLWSAYDWQTQSGGSYLFAGIYNLTFWIGAYDGVGNANSPLLTNNELWGLDDKIDDGKPATGTVFIYASNANFADCTYNPAGGAVTNTTLTAEYLHDETMGCVSGFRLQN